MAAGFDRPGARTTASTFDAAATVMLVEHDDVEVAASFLKPVLALYIGGWVRRRELHHDVFVRMGWGDACAAIQSAYLGGDRDAAAALVPTRLVEDVALVGPADKIVEEISAEWRPTCLTSLILGGWPRGPDASSDPRRGARLRHVADAQRPRCEVP